MGEIGISRHEFYYELKWWEVKSIIRGYNARHHHGWEQARLIAYNARFCRGSENPIPTVTNWLKFPWEMKRRFKANPVSNEDIDNILADIKAANATK